MNLPTGATTNRNRKPLIGLIHSKESYVGRFEIGEYQAPFAVRGFAVSVKIVMRVFDGSLQNRGGYNTIKYRARHLMLSTFPKISTPSMYLTYAGHVHTYAPYFA
jgi:hypothetical protein